MGITFSKQRSEGGGDGKGSTPSPRRAVPGGVRMPPRTLAPDAKAGKSPDARSVVVPGLPDLLVDRPLGALAAGAGARRPSRRMSESDVSAPAPRGLARWQVASLPGPTDGTPSPRQPSLDSGPSLAWLKDESSPMALMEFKHAARAACQTQPGPPPQGKAGSTGDLFDREPDAVSRRNLERLTLLQQAAVRVDRTTDEKSVARAARWQPAPLWPPSVDFAKLAPQQAAQWVVGRLKEARAAELDAGALRNLAQELISHHKALTVEQLQAMGRALGDQVRVEAPDMAPELRYQPLARLLTPLCALACRAWATEQLGSLLSGVRTAFAASDRQADLQFQRAINAALEQGVPWGHCVAMACGLYHGSNDRPGRAFLPVRLDRQAWPSPHERLAAVLSWGRRLVLDAPSVYASDARVPQDRRFEWMMSALAIPGVAWNQQGVFTQGRSLQAATEAMTPAQREALEAAKPAVLCAASSVSSQDDRPPRQQAVTAAGQVR